MLALGVRKAVEECEQLWRCKQSDWLVPVAFGTSCSVRGTNNPTQAQPIPAPLQMITAGQMFNILSLITLSILSQYVPK